MSHFVIREVRTAHCKRGPARCARCREMDVPRWCLLDVDPPDPGRAQRRVTEVVVGGERTWREYEIVRAFASEEEARTYAEEHGIW